MATMSTIDVEIFCRAALALSILVFQCLEFRASVWLPLGHALRISGIPRT